jgi:hypothetical protein
MNDSIKPRIVATRSVEECDSLEKEGYQDTLAKILDWQIEDPPPALEVVLEKDSSSIVRTRAVAG